MRGFCNRLAVALFVLFSGVAYLSVMPMTLQAQTIADELDYARWEQVATRAEGVLEDQRASTIALEELRGDIVNWRARFSSAQNINHTRIATVRNQLDALGPVPEDNATETQDIAERRSELDSQLARLEAPRRKADEAFSRADGIVREIDTIVRERQAEILTQLGPSPMNPVNWPVALKSLAQTGNAVRTEISSAWRSENQQAELRKNLPVTLFYLAIAVVLLGRGRHWMERLTLRVQGGKPRSARGLQGFVVSIGQVLVPIIGLFALVEALFSTKLFGFRGQIIIQGLPLIGVAAFSARWLAIRLFPKNDTRQGLLNLALEIRRELRLYSVVLGVIVGLSALLSSLAEYEDYSPATHAVLAFPLLIVAGLILFRAGLILIRSPVVRDGINPDTGNLDLRGRMARMIGQAMIAIGVTGPIIAAIGYLVAAGSFMFPAIVSLGLIGLLLVLHGVIRDLYGLISGVGSEGAKDALMPVLISFCMMLVSTPLFALIWGARVSELTELWTRFGEGIALGDARISPSDFLAFAFVFLVGYGLTRLLQGVLRSSVLPKTKMDIGGQTAVVSGIGYIGIFLAALVAISAAGIDLSSLAIVAGALSVGIGFGLQNIVSNFVSGIILLIERPISEGDWIEVGEEMGIVRDISVRSTRIETFDRTDVIVPNSDLISGTVTNFTRGNLIGRAVVPVGVAYGTDTHKVEEILLEIARAHPLVALNPPPAVDFIGFGADSLDFRIRAILRDVNFILTVKTEMNHEIARRFAEEGIEIPFAQRDVWLRNPEVLQPKPATRKGKGAS